LSLSFPNTMTSPFPLHLIYIKTDPSPQSHRVHRAILFTCREMPASEKDNCAFDSRVTSSACLASNAIPLFEISGGTPTQKCCFLVCSECFLDKQERLFSVHSVALWCTIHSLLFRHLLCGAELNAIYRLKKRIVIFKPSHRIAEMPVIFPSGDQTRHGPPSFGDDNMFPPIGHLTQEL